MKRMSHMNRGAILALVVTGSLYADPVPQPQVSFTQGSGSTWNADWTGIAGRTYFAQGSIDLVNWEFLPVLEFGTGLKGAGISTTGATKYFYRLKYVDASWVTTEQQARDADFDSDGIPNWFEVEEIGSDPLDRLSAGDDFDSDGMPDGWELFHFSSLSAAPGTIGYPLPTGDGLTNKEKAELGLDPDIDYSSATATQPSKYTYDGAGRLTGVTAPVAAATYTLDEEGNILNAQ